MLPAVLMLLEWAAGDGAAVVEGRGINLSAPKNMPLYRAERTQPMYAVDDNQPRYKVSQ